VCGENNVVVGYVAAIFRWALAAGRVAHPCGVCTSAPSRCSCGMNGGVFQLEKHGRPLTWCNTGSGIRKRHRPRHRIQNSQRCGRLPESRRRGINLHLVRLAHLVHLCRESLARRQVKVVSGLKKEDGRFCIAHARVMSDCNAAGGRPSTAQGELPYKERCRPEDGATFNSRRAGQAFKKDCTSIPASRRIARSVPSARSPL